MECYKVALLYFKAFGHHKYAFSVINLLCNIKFDENESNELMWERFINNHGIPGKNISMDLHLEHLNNFLKDLLKNLRNNMNETNAERISKAMNNIKALVDKTEVSLGIKKSTSGSNKGPHNESVKLLVTELLKENPFTSTKKGYKGFENFTGQLLVKLDSTNFLKWAKKRITENKASAALSEM